ncbi:MAG: alpha/beta fold hydrolase [Rhodoferax sp.]|nr:alpha/beta fold hydrolase [Rhodoferax sp.]
MRLRNRIEGALMLLALLLALLLWTPDLDRATLETRYLQAPGDLVEMDGQRLHVRDSGPADAPAILMIHGFAASLHTWEPWAQALAGPFRVLRLDLPGSGLSAPDARGNCRDDRTVALLGALLDQRGIRRAHLLGHSIGGRIAWTFAATHPERVDRLVLLAPDGFASPGFAYGQAPEVPAMLGLMRYVLPAPLLRMNLAPAYADPATLTDAMHTRYHDLLRAPGSRQALLERMRQTVLVDPVPLLHRIQAPTLLLWGDRDAFIPTANAEDFLRALPQARLVRLPGVGHVPQEESPQAGLDAVRSFLR